MDYHISGLIWTDWKRTWNRRVVANHKFLKCCTKKGKTTTLLLSNWIIAWTTERNLLCYTCNSEYWFLSLKLCNFLIQTLTPRSYSQYWWSPTVPRLQVPVCYCSGAALLPDTALSPTAQIASEGTLRHSNCTVQREQSCTSSWGLMASLHAPVLSSRCFSDPYGTETKPTTHQRWNTENLVLHSIGPCSGDTTTNAFGHVQ